MACIARLDAWRGFNLPLLIGASRKRFIHSITPSEPMERLGGSLAAHLIAVEQRRRHHPHARCRADASGARRRRRHQARPMSDTIFVTGLALHAYHGVMQHEAKVGQTFKLDLVLDIDLADRLAHRQAQGHRLLRHGGEDGERGILRAAATGWSKPRPAPSPRRCSSAVPQVTDSASPCTSRTRRSPRLSTTSAWQSNATRAAKMAEVRRPSAASRLAAMSATCGQISIGRSPCCATATACGF